MPLFSVIVPHTDDTHSFDNTLATILRDPGVGSADVQVILAHDGDYSDPYGLAQEVEFAVAARGSGLAGLINCGLRKADGEFTAILRPGVELPDDWKATVADAFDSPTVAMVSPLIVHGDDPGRIVAAGVRQASGYTRALTGTNRRIAGRVLKKLTSAGPTLWAAFYRRDFLAELGSLDEQLDPHYLDLDIALAASSLGYQCRPAFGCRVTMERPFPLLREATTPHGSSAQRAFQRHKTGTSTGDRILAAVGDLVRSPFQPFLARHAVQRSAAGRSKDIDLLFARRIARILDERQLESAIAGRIGESDQGRADSFTTKRSGRRRAA